MYAALSVAWVAALAVEVVRRYRAGKVLVDLGGNSRAGLYIGMGAMMVVVGAVLVLADVRGNLFRGLAHMLWGAWFVLMGTRHVQIREGGIFGRRKLIKWAELVGFSLQADGCCG